MNANELIKLTVVTGVKNVEGPVWVNPDRIFYIAPTHYIHKGERDFVGTSKPGTNINGELIVKETVEEILQRLGAETVPVVRKRSKGTGDGVSPDQAGLHEQRVPRRTVVKKIHGARVGKKNVELELKDI